jgi:hypothetical protein
MKYLRKFNEELNRETYLSAASKLKDKGHKKRSKSLKKYAKSIIESDPIEIAKICEKYGIKNYTINNGLVDVDGDVDVSGGTYILPRFPFKFGRVSGSFFCYYCNLKTLEGSPIEVGGDFVCGYNDLKTLKGAPQKVGGKFSCNCNDLISLEGAPSEVGDSFHCHYNKLKTLKGSPREVGDDFDCGDNNLKTLEGGPIKVGGYFRCENNPNLPLKIRIFGDKKFILKNQDDYSIWRKDGKLDQYRWRDMLLDREN